MNNKILTWVHDCAADIAALSVQDNIVDCNYIRFNQWAHAEQWLFIEGLKRGVQLLTMPMSGEVLPLIRDTYKFSIKARTPLLSDWTDELECFTNMKPPARPLSPQVSPIMRATGVLTTAYEDVDYIPKISGYLRIVQAGSPTVSLQVYRKCSDSGNLGEVMAVTNVTPTYEVAGSRPAVSVLDESCYVIAGILYNIKVRNTHAATQNISLDVSVDT